MNTVMQNVLIEISKLVDGNIWMTRNLDWDLDSSKTYTNLDTDLGWNDNGWALGNNQKIWESPIYLGLFGGWCLGVVGGSVESWSFVVNNYEGAYGLYVSSDGNVFPDGDGSRSDGGVVRCVAR